MNADRPTGTGEAFSFANIIRKQVKEKLAWVEGRKEELLTAWVAKYGSMPDEAALFIQDERSDDSSFVTRTKYWVEPHGKRGMIYQEIGLERARQDAKWGEQNWPSVSDAFMRSHAAAPDEDTVKHWIDACSKDGTLTFAHIAYEEFVEVVHATDDVARRAEIVQLAAVCVQWIEAIDRRAAK